VNRFENGFQSGCGSKDQKNYPDGTVVPSTASWCILTGKNPAKKENAMDLYNHTKAAHLHRLAGGGPITIYEAESKSDVKTLYSCIQKLCNNSRDVRIRKNRIVSDNTLLVHYLKELVKEQQLVPQYDNICGVMVIEK
jgi:hypothetical protein